MEYKELVVENISKILLNFSDLGEGAYLLKDRNQLLYIVDRKIHRDNGPAQIRAELGFKKLDRGVEKIVVQRMYFTYYKYGFVHCETGPAYVAYDNRSSEPVEERYYLKGKQLTKKQWENQIQTKLYW